jgi:hypothetical protein
MAIHILLFELRASMNGETRMRGRGSRLAEQYEKKRKQIEVSYFFFNYTILTSTKALSSL